MSNRNITAIKYTAGQPEETSEVLTGEEALQIKINGRPYTITMRTPGEDKILTAGLLFTERVIENREDIINLSEIPAALGHHTLIVEAQVTQKALEGKNLFNRSIASSASCGVCGKIELCDLHTPEPPLLSDQKIDVQLIPDLLQQMQERQSTFERTGGSHAAAIFSLDGTLLSAKEDIGRHNAVDKVIGHLLLENKLHKASILFISGRVSYEITAKCAAASIPFLLAVSAPSSLAVSFCQQMGITLIGFCRANRATVYTNKKNVLQFDLISQEVSTMENNDEG
jgi:FdhD protein